MKAVMAQGEIWKAQRVAFIAGPTPAVRLTVEMPPAFAPH